MVDKDRIKGTGHQIKGSMKEAAGKMTGDTTTQIEGKAEKEAGKMQKAAGSAKDKARETLDK
jgi:uncharacterized protein YjbJ (UPF0337 family)